MSMLGKHHTKEAKRKMVHIGRKNGMFGQHHSEEAKRKISIAKKGKNVVFLGGHADVIGDKNPFWGKRHTKKTIVKISRANKNNKYCLGRVVTKQTRELIASKAKERFRNPEYVKRLFKVRRPNKKELALLAIIQNLSLPYSYVGDGQFILGGKCPDFLNTNGQKKLIELYGDYWHKDDDPQDRIDYFIQYGFETLVIWESELHKPAKVEERLLNFDAKRLGMP